MSRAARPSVVVMSGMVKVTEDAVSSVSRPEMPKGPALSPARKVSASRLVTVMVTAFPSPRATVICSVRSSSMAFLIAITQGGGDAFIYFQF